MIDKKLKYRRLAAVLSIKGFVKNEPLCNSEIYLRELINHSKYFLKLSNGQEYDKPLSEAEGEYDAISDAYSIDFKTAESQTIMESKSQLSYSIYCLADGVTSFGGSNRSGESVGIVLHSALRTLINFDDIDNLLNKERERYTKLENRSFEITDRLVLYDLQRFFDVIRKDKNLLLFLPIEFFLDYKSSHSIEVIKEALWNDFSLSFKYRFERFSDKDTFISCIYDHALIIYKFTEKGFLFADKIDLDCSSTFTYLKESYDSFGA